MSGSLELYRTTVNLRGLGVGAAIEIDPTDPAWAGDIAKKRIVPVRLVEAEAAEESRLSWSTDRAVVSTIPVEVDDDDDPESDLDDEPVLRSTDRTAWLGGGAWADTAGTSTPGGGDD